MANALWTAHMPSGQHPCCTYAAWTAHTLSGQLICSLDSPATILFGSSACGSATKSTASCANLPPAVLNMETYNSSDESDDTIPDTFWKRDNDIDSWRRIRDIEKRCSRRCSQAFEKCQPAKGEAHRVCILSVQGGRDSAEPPQKKHKQEDAGVKLHVLKAILEEWSPVLRTKLESWCSSTQGGETIINIGEFTPEVTEHFTRFLYKAPPYLDHVNSTCCSPVCGDAPPCDAVARVLRGQLASRSGFHCISECFGSAGAMLSLAFLLLLVSVTNACGYQTGPVNITARVNVKLTF